MKSIAFRVALLAMTFLSVSLSGYAQKYYPGGLGATNLKVWLSAATDTSMWNDSARTNRTTNISGRNKVSFWKDLSGNSNHFVQGDSASAAPTWDQSTGTLVFNGSQELHRPVASAFPLPVPLDVNGISTTDWSLGIVLQENGTGITASRPFHMGYHSTSTPTAGNDAFDVAMNFSHGGAGNDDHTTAAQKSTSIDGLVLRYSSNAAGSTGQAAPKTVLYKSVPTGDPTLADMPDIMTTLNVGVFAMKNGSLMTGSSTGVGTYPSVGITPNPSVLWNGSALLAAGNSSNNSGQFIKGTGGTATTSVGAVRSGTAISNGFTGRIAAVLLYTKKLTASESIIVSNYLNAMNSPTVSLATNDFFQQDVEGGAGTPKACRYDLVGVGRAVTGDYVSATVNTARGLGFGTADYSSAPDNSFIMAANNGGDSLSAAPSSITNSPLLHYRLNRVWKIQKSGFGASGDVGPATIPVTFSFNDYYPASASVKPRAAWNSRYALLRSASSTMTNADSIAVAATGEGNVTSITFNVPLTALMNGYYTISSVQDSALSIASTIGSNVPLPTTLNASVELGDGVTATTATVSSNTTINGNLSINTNTTFTIAAGTTVTVNGAIKLSGSLNVAGILIIKSTKAFMKGTGGSITLTGAGQIQYEPNANLYYTGSGGSGTVSFEWPETNGPENLRMTGSNTVVLDKDHSINKLTEINNGVLQLNGKKLTMRGSCVKTTNGRIRGGVAGDSAQIIIDGVTGAFDLPKVELGLKKLHLTNANTNQVVNLSSDLVLHEDFSIETGTLDIDGAKSNQFQKLTLNGNCAVNPNGKLRGGDHSDLEVGEVTYNSQTMLTLPQIEHANGVGLRKLQISRGAGAKLTSDLYVADSVDLFPYTRLTRGMLNIDVYKLTIGPTGWIDEETEQYPIIGNYTDYLNDPTVANCGRITTTRPNLGAGTFNFGNIGATITFTNPPGNTTVTRNYTQWKLTTPVARTIKRSYSITTANSGSLGATLVLKYRDYSVAETEVDGLTEANFVMLRSTNHGGIWQPRSYTSRDASANTVTLTGIDAFSDWTLADENVLPVELTTFTASHLNGKTRLMWRTATESNNHGFDVERRLDDPECTSILLSGEKAQQATEWQVIGFVAGAGMSSAPRQYEFTDQLEGVDAHCRAASYRLHQIDRDGHSSYSPVVRVALTATSPRTFSLDAPYPNPASVHSSGTLNLSESASVTLTLMTLDGRSAATILQNCTLEAGVHRVAIPRGTLPSGTYFLVMETSHGRKVQPLTFLP